MESERMIEELKGDLFMVGNEYSLAHCVSRDFKMGKGIAAIFRSRFGGVDELKAQQPQIGGCAELRVGARFVFYLVTKEKYFNKPTYEDLTRSLEMMKNKCLQFGVVKLAMPKIGCGLDKLDWVRVKDILASTFLGTGISIKIFIL